MTAVCLIIIVIDQLSKYLISSSMTLGFSFPVINGIFHITYIQNSGAAFGVLAEKRWIFIAAGIIIIGLAAYFRKKIMRERPVVRYGTAMLVGGAIGNLIDRIMIGRVIDFLDFRVWPIFNIADIGICVGVALLMYELVAADFLGGHCDSEDADNVETAK